MNQLNQESSFTIGKLAQQADVNVETIRFYQRKKLIKEPPKKQGFRYYNEEHVALIQFIKQAQQLGFSLNEIKEILALQIKKQSKCQDVLVKAEKKIEEIDVKIQDLKKIKKSLKKLTDCCEDRNISLSKCPVLDFFMEQK